ncbi:MAG: hypothetical protein R2706_06415 [Acidimicrobiales bacterium]
MYKRLAVIAVLVGLPIFMQPSLKASERTTASVVTPAVSSALTIRTTTSGANEGDASTRRDDHTVDGGGINDGRAHHGGPHHRGANHRGPNHRGANHHRRHHP